MTFPQATPLYALLHHDDGGAPSPVLVVGWAADAGGDFHVPIYTQIGAGADLDGVTFRGNGHFSHVGPHEPSVDY